MFDVDNYPTWSSLALTALLFWAFVALLIVVVAVGWELSDAWIAGEIVAALRELVGWPE